ncbi:trinucleotide repeat-containing gene 18 protein isoform X2 [Frankliniella occidentalis]|uniref:Trinucleotide repeat-containing gene 18 protein isoform X2 n=1 Tax=Frankliniella occidentalis TaxID=133901 RepID=A0A9C6U5L1_FRAOC|nr:trinucleotide repeat-containing gene 18 protein isoform X2 [Frankliniella occidentalis]
MVRDPASQYVLLAAPGISLDPMSRPMMWSSFGPQPLLLPPPGMLLDPMLVSSASGSTCASTSVSASGSMIALSRTVSSHGHSMSTQCVSNVVTLPGTLSGAVPIPGPPLPLPTSAMPSPTLLTVASMCQSSVECSAAPWTTLPHPGQADRDPGSKLMMHQPKCISDGESTVITQVADPSKQCSAGVQTQSDGDGTTNEFISSPTKNPTAEEKEESRPNKIDCTLNETFNHDASEPVKIETLHVSTDSRPEFDENKECETALSERSTAFVFVEADSNCEQECLTSPELHISSSYQESEDLTNVPEKPNELDVSGLELLYKSIEHMESLENRRSVLQEPSIEVEQPPEVQKPKLDGLGLLCALAEQRIQEELNKESGGFKLESDSPICNSVKPTADVNRNYRTPKSEQEVRRFLATRTETSHAVVSPVTFKLEPQNDSLEMEMRNRLAELQRMYKETQRELSRLTPRKNSIEGESSSGSHNGSTPIKRTPAKSAQFRKKKIAVKKKTPLKSETLNDPPPPVLERVTDVVEVPIPKIKWSRLDAPPTLIPHKLPTEVGHHNPPSFKLNLVKLPATKDHKRRWSVDSPSTRVSTETQHADDEDSDELWSEFISKSSETVSSNRKHKSSNEVSSLHSTSKRRKVGKPKRHFDKAGNGHHATETIVPKQPRNKASLVSYLLASKTAGPGKLQSSEKSSKEYSKATVETPTHSPEHRPKIRPKLKAEVKVKETWEDEDLLDWSTPKPQLPSHPLRPLDLVFECMEEISNGQDKGLGLKRHEEDDEDDEWRPSSKKTKSPAVPLKPVSNANFPQQKHSSEKTPPTAKPKKPSNLSKERRQSTEKLHLKKPVCSSVEERLPLKVSNDPTSCVLTAEILETADFPARTLTAQGGLFYAGLLNAVMPPDLYSIILHGERASRPNIYSREEILQDTILEVRPPDVESLSIGTRLCAYWSQQTKCLYPGVVVPPTTPDPSLDGDFVTVEFDDGDSGQIRIQDIRLLPSNYPVVEFDPNPLLSLTKRRRRNSEKSVDSKDRRVSADSAISSNASFVENPKLEDKKELTVTEISENESKRLKKRRREKLKRLMTASAAASSADTRKRKHKHKHRRKHRHRHSSTGSSSDAPLKADLDNPFPDAIIKSIISKEPISPHPSIKEEISAHPSIKEEMSFHLSIKEEIPAHLSLKEDIPAHPSIKEEISELEDDWKGKENEERDEEVEDKDKDLKEGWETGTEPDTNTDQIENESIHPDTNLSRKPKKKQDRQNSVERSKIAAFLPPRKLWGWSGKGYKRQGGKGRKKEFYKCIQRDKEEIKVGDCAVFLSTNSPDRPYIGRIESLWETYNGMMVVRVKWFYHPEETEGCPTLKYPGGLFQSDHADDNDVQTISHRCEVLPLSEYEKKVNHHTAHLVHLQDVYYLAGSYDPKNIQIKLEKGVVG